MITLKGIKFYSSATEMPIEREWAFKRYLLFISNGMHDPYEAVMKVSEFIQNESYEQAQAACRNWYQSIYMNLEMFDPQSFAFACLIHSIDGNERTDLTEDGLKETLDLIKDKVTKEEIIEKVYEVKKKITNECEKYFPNLFDYKKREKNFISSYKNMIAELAKSAIAGEYTKQYHELHNYINGVLQPLYFDPESSHSADISHDLYLENMSAKLSEFTSKDVKKMTVIEFYALLNQKLEQSKSQGDS